MKRNSLKILISLFILTSSAYSQSNSWNDLTPLRSNRQDVEKLLGKPTDDEPYGVTYKTEKEKVQVLYTSEKCENGWDVPKDTVLRMEVYDSDVGKSFDELKLDKNLFSHTVDDAFYATWTNTDEGVQYYFNGYQQLESITYLPKKSDNYLRCNGFPSFQPEAQHYPFDKFLFYNPALSKKESLYSVFSRLDNFIFSLQNYKSDHKGYVLVYFDKKLSFKEYEKRLKKLKDFLFKFRKISPEMVTVIDGGIDYESRVELYILPKEWKPPAPDPTYPSPQFMKK